ncbi:TIM barrel protein [Halomonas maura]|uniref:TIM barrel protein n=1 Tax=Halomonas maura TaxID=117606 RepID=UPI0025B545CC|nr:TIM barrel protein [Halomonas maura]MDN3557840.1 TIM barrel protein [Halomonas maura]
MSQQPLKFSLNHMACPHLSPRQLVEAAAELGLGAVELRNDVHDNSVTDADQARAIGDRAKELGIEILSINALYPFNIWNAERAAQAENLARLVAACGGRGLVLCPLVDGDYPGSEDDKTAGLKQALTALDGILGQHDLQGFVEPLGFPISTLRTKQAAMTAIRELGLEQRFGLVHDTFHHVGVGEQAFFAANTGLVHISGVEDPAIGFADMLDAHRLLVGPRDRLDNIGQLRQLLADGYGGHVSFEPFAEEVHQLADPLAAVKGSMDYLREHLAR